MIKVGDCIIPKDEASEDRINDVIVTKFPMEVKKLIPCEHQGKSDGCYECPGLINNKQFGCFSYQGIYSVQRMSTDWDE